MKKLISGWTGYRVVIATMVLLVTLFCMTGCADVVSAAVDEPAVTKTASLVSEPVSVTTLLEDTAMGLQDRFSPMLGKWAQNTAFADVTWFALCFSGLLLVFVVLVERLLNRLVWHRVASVPEAPEQHPGWAFFMYALYRPFAMALFVYCIYIALFPFYTLGDNGVGSLIRQACETAVALFTWVLVIWFVLRLVTLVDIYLKQWAAKTENTVDDLLVPLVGKIARVLIVLLGGVFLIQNMTGVEIGPLLASLGIGGIAIALAAKDSIANFFGTLTIIFDKPFQTGERIVIEGNDGVVESVGFRSTRVRTLSGHLLTLPNEKVINSSIENIGKRPNIRWLNNIGITYDTPPDKVERAVTIIREILDNHEGMNEEFPPRVYFNGFNDWSLNILVVAWYHPPDFWAFQAWVQQTCLSIMRRLEAEDIDFAFPSRTVYLANDDKRQLRIDLPKDGMSDEKLS
ncbi:MAG: mechanosensitive ion channel family protein [Thermodesulfobacteriota bacterium]|nr:mechanosensitive ion channel family protein [Thermodesulfobacteriota bacterium]